MNAALAEIQPLLFEFLAMDTPQRQHRRFAKCRCASPIYGMIFCDHAADVNPQRWLTFHLIQQCVEAQFILRAWWAVKAKYQLAELQTKDPNMHRLVARCLQMPVTLHDDLRNLCTHVLEPIGGWMKSEWQIE
ncbi:hypothetical protein [Alicyclobacillus fodiniaquatilis]|uniref:Uncharacterized protein n=1 Tax=Alicyclobacillus fodiniaquatilis TaxID=1661150 RepID=A0ABW4JQA0_9BACL